MPSKFGGILVETTESKFGGIPVDAQPEIQLEVQPDIKSGLDFQAMTKAILDQYNAGSFSPRKIEMFDELKTRGAFEMPMSVAALGADISIEDPEKLKLEDVGKYAAETVKAIPGSAKQAITELYEAFRHPARTKAAVASLAEGALQKLKPGEQPQEKYVDALLEAMKERYGSVESTLETIKTDPVGAAGDIASLLSGVGGILKTTKAGQAIQRIGVAMEPITPITKGVKKIVEKVPQFLAGAKTPSALYQSAVKFSTTLPEHKRTALAETALKSGIMPTYEGLDKLWANINDLNKKISEKIDIADSAGETMNISELFKDFGELKKDALLSAKPKSKMSAINNIEKQIKDANKAINRKRLTPIEAQKMKQNIYKDMKEYYDKRLKEPPSAKAQKAVAKQTKLFLEEVIPGIKQINKKDSDYIALAEALDRPVSRIANRDLIGIGAPIKGTAGFAIGAAAGMPELGTALGVTMAILDHPRVKARLAIILDKMEDLNIDPGPDARALMNVLYETRKIEEQE